MFTYKGLDELTKLQIFHNAFTGARVVNGNLILDHHDGTSVNVCPIGNVSTAQQAAIDTAINNLKGGVSTAYDTLQEIAAQLANDESAESALLTLVTNLRNLSDSTFVTALNNAYVGRNPTFGGPTYDANGNLTAWTENGTACSATYNADGTVATLTVGTVTRTFSYDANSNLTGAA